MPTGIGACHTNRCREQVTRLPPVCWKRWGSGRWEKAHPVQQFLQVGKRFGEGLLSHGLHHRFMLPASFLRLVADVGQLFRGVIGGLYQLVVRMLHLAEAFQGGIPFLTSLRVLFLSANEAVEDGGFFCQFVAERSTA